MFACGGVTVMGKHWPAASNNGFGGAALVEKMGVYVFESLSQDLNSSKIQMMKYHTSALRVDL